jgi:hypothetical protein
VLFNFDINIFLHPNPSAPPPRQVLPRRRWGALALAEQGGAAARGAVEGKQKVTQVSGYSFWRLWKNFCYFIFLNRVFELPLLRNARKCDLKKTSKTTEGGGGNGGGGGGGHFLCRAQVDLFGGKFFGLF